MSAALKLPIYMTVQEFLAWSPGDHSDYELVNGEPRAMAPAATIHGYLQNEIGRLIGNHLIAHRPGCSAITTPGIIPRLLSAHNFRIPDLGVTCAPVEPEQLSLPDPILLVEILSPSNQADTWSNVWTYTTIPSVQEILILHSTRVAADLLRRSGGGGWPDEPEHVTEGDLMLASIGFCVAMVDLYARTGLVR
ncbi:MAG: Uma2 family endonuclease [Acetobacteraceae bacterium]